MSLGALSGFGESRAVDIDAKDLSLLTNDVGGEYSGPRISDQAIS